ncbi:MAG: D-glycero-beta-D-manno-heptose 1,7-bisphosphate 7-phosphatase [Pseudomonadota bacterium]
MKTALLDRDGVINKDRSDYVKSWEEFEFIPGSIAAISLLKKKGYQTILVTNQSAVKRGIISKDQLEVIHKNMLEAIASEGGKIDAIYYCPHTPDEECSCRKPEPGLILQAQNDLGFDPALSVMIGDDARDIMAGKAAGCGKLILVKTGKGKDVCLALAEKKINIDYFAEDLLDGVRWLVSESHELLLPK